MKHPEVEQERQRLKSARWREANPDKVKAQNNSRSVEYNRNSCKKYYEKHKYEILAKRKMDYLENPDGRRVLEVKRKFGFSKEDYERLKEDQKNLCAICARPQVQDRKNLDVGHNHRTKQVRQLLCGDCNKAIGLLRDDPEVAEKVASYLRKWSGLEAPK